MSDGFIFISGVGGSAISERVWRMAAPSLIPQPQTDFGTFVLRNMPEMEDGGVGRFPAASS